MNKIILNMVELNKLLLSRKTVIEMLSDRGFIKLPPVNISAEELYKQYSEDNMKIIATKKDKKITIMVLFHQTKKSDGKIGIDVIKTLSGTVKDEKATHVLLIVSNKLTHAALKEFKKSCDEVEIFYDNEMYFNIMKHNFQPKFKLLSEVEKKKIIKKFGKHIPLIKTTDRVCNYFNAKPGNIFEITRRDGSLYYRLVIV